MNKEHGFSLIELIIVVAILGVIAAVATPNYINYLYTSRISSDISSARQLAVSVDMYCGTHGLTEIPEDYAQSKLQMYKRPESGADNSAFACVKEGDTVIVSFVADSKKAGKYAGYYEVPAHGNLPQPMVGGMEE